MSGGAYALLGMQLGDVVLNWERKSAPYRPLGADSRILESIRMPVPAVGSNMLSTKRRFYGILGDSGSCKL